MVKTQDSRTGCPQRSGRDHSAGAIVPSEPAFDNPDLHNLFHRDALIEDMAPDHGPRQAGLKQKTGGLSPP